MKNKQKILFFIPSLILIIISQKMTATDKVPLSALESLNEDVSHEILTYLTPQEVFKLNTTKKFFWEIPVNIRKNQSSYGTKLLNEKFVFWQQTFSFIKPTHVSKFNDFIFLVNNINSNQFQKFWAYETISSSLLMSEPQYLKIITKNLERNLTVFLKNSERCFSSERPNKVDQIRQIHAILVLFYAFYQNLDFAIFSSAWQTIESENLGIDHNRLKQAQHKTKLHQANEQIEDLLRLINKTTDLSDVLKSAKEVSKEGDFLIVNMAIRNYLNHENMSNSKADHHLVYKVAEKVNFLYFLSHSSRLFEAIYDDSIKKLELISDENFSLQSIKQCEDFSNLLASNDTEDEELKHYVKPWLNHIEHLLKDLRAQYEVDSI